jgi:hypothetical protein
MEYFVCTVHTIEAEAIVHHQPKVPELEVQEKGSHKDPPASWGGTVFCLHADSFRRSVGKFLWSHTVLGLKIFHCVGFAFIPHTGPLAKSTSTLSK